MTIRSQGRNYFRPALAPVQTLLRDAQLPTSDLSAAHLEHFIACGSREALDGVVGVEMYPPYALLRSLAVAPNRRNHGIGRALVVEAERRAQTQGVQELFLLTSTAERFFAGLRYARSSRNDAPAAIRATAEFATLCPESAALMRKRLA